MRDAALLDAVGEIVSIVREHADEGERGRRLPQPVVEAFTKAGVFRVAVPKELGGLEADAPTMLRVFEEISKADASAGWCAMIAGTGGLFGGFVADDAAREIFGPNPDVATGGAVNPAGGQARRDGQNWRVTGRWSLASGCQHCGWLFGGALLMDGSDLVIGESGPEWMMFAFPAAQAQILDTWHVSGLRGTGSHDFEVKDVTVPAGRAIRVANAKPMRTGPLYALPLVGTLATAVASVSLGVGRAALDEIERLAAIKTPMGATSSLANRPMTQAAVAEAEAALRSARSFFYETVGACWDTVTAGDPIELQQRALLRLACTNATRSATLAVDTAYTHGGSTSIYDSSPLQRHFRDIHAITQHVATAPHTLEPIGRVLLGVPMDTSLF